MDLTVAPDAEGVAKVLYPGTENLAATFHMASPLRLEAVYRAKADDPTGESLIQWYLVDAPSQAAVKDYHDYIIRFERPPAGFVGFRVYWFGRAYCSVWIDQVRLLEEPLMSEAEQLKGVKVEGLAVDHAASATLVWAGVYNWTYRIPDAIGGRCVWGSPPEIASALPKVDAMLFSEVVLGGMPPPERLLVSEFVKAGGGLVLLGGVCGYGKSQVHASPLLADLLPVTTKGLWDLRKAPAGGLVVQPAGQRFRGLRWDAGPRVYYYHEVSLKGGTQVWLKGTAAAEGKPVEVPLLVARPVGRGWVVAFLGTPLGEAEVGQTPIWDWADWGRLLTIAVNASRGRDDDQGTEKPTWTWPVPQVPPPPPAPQPVAALPSPPPSKAASERFEIAEVRSAKICYRPGEWASGAVVLINGTDKPAAGKLVVSVLSNFDDRSQLLAQDVSIAARQTTTVPVVWKIGPDERFGREFHAELAAPDGKTLDAKGEYFTVGWNNYRLGQCRLVQPWTFDTHSKALPDITPEDRWRKWIPGVRKAGAVVTEYFFWAPDDFGNLTPTEDRWFSGQATYLISQADVHAVIDAAHDNGLAAVTYGKNWMGVAGLQTQRDGVELVRRHPEWCQWMVSGQPKWSFNVDQYRWTFDQWRQFVHSKTKTSIGLVAVNCYVSECVRFGCQEIVRSAAKYGWDGVRFDDHFTLESVFDGGLLFDGRAYENGEDFETLSTRNNRWTREITRACNPNFLLGFNYAGVYAERGIRHPEAYAETARDGGFLMLEWSSWWPDSLKTWGKVATVLARENHRVHALGGVAGMCHMGSKNPSRDQVGRWESAINYASQGHYYNVADTPAVVRHTLFMLRYGGVLYDANTHHAPEAAKLFSVSSDAGLVWEPFVHERLLGPTRRQIIAGLINIDPAGAIDDMKLPQPPAKDVRLAFTPPPGWRVAKAWLLDPDGRPNCAEVGLAVAEGKAQVALPTFECWNLLVLELASD
jgi:hypothetical protein